MIAHRQLRVQRASQSARTVYISHYQDNTKKMKLFSCYTLGNRKSGHYLANDLVKFLLHALLHNPPM